MRTSIFTALIATFLLPSIAQAKRMEPAKVHPVEYDGIRYTAPNDDGRRGYIQAVDVKTGKTLYEIVVFKNTIDPAMEEDVQWVFIKSLKIEKGVLIVTDERDHVYAVDLKTRAVKAISAP